MASPRVCFGNNQRRAMKPARTRETKTARMRMRFLTETIYVLPAEQRKCLFSWTAIQQGIYGVYVQWREYPCRRLQLCPGHQLRVECQIIIALRSREVCRRRQQVNDGAAPNLITLPGPLQRYLGGSHRLLPGLKVRYAVLQLQECSLCVQLDLVLKICKARASSF